MKKLCLFLFLSAIISVSLIAQTDTLTASGNEDSLVLSPPSSGAEPPEVPMEISGFEEPSEETTIKKNQFSENALIGKWERMGNHYNATLTLDGEYYYMEKYFAASESKIGEVYMKYLFMQDSIILEGLAGDNSRSAFWLRKLTADSLVLQDAQNFELHTFLRTNDTISSAPQRFGELLMINGVLTCGVDIETPSEDFSPCLRIGELTMDITLDELEEKYGHPVKFVQSRKDSTLSKYVFNLQPFEGTQPELIVTHKSDTDEIIELQVRGFGSVEGLNFSSVRLGDYLGYVEQRFGKPAEIRKDNETLTTKWYYAPFPVMFEFKNKYVNGIKIFRKAGDEKE
ncbi:MAG: hypothetical protein K1X92_08155 [Bacteroidia bacterium]|nr:hypothetical protein [Bacteroidia bacterium]